jgi:hypothetical protein
MPPKDRISGSKEPLTPKQVDKISSLKKGEVPKDFGGARARRNIEQAKAKDAKAVRAPKTVNDLKENAKDLGIKNTKLLDDATAEQRAKVARALGVLGGFFGTLATPTPAYKRGGRVRKPKK